MSPVALGTVSPTTVVIATCDIFISFYVLSALYAVISVVAALQLIRIFIIIPNGQMDELRLFHLLVGLASALRAIFFGVSTILTDCDGDYESANSCYNGLFDSLNTLPSLTYFSQYSILVYFWAKVYYGAHGLDLELARRLERVIYATALGINLLVYIIFSTFVSIDMVIPSTRDVVLRLTQGFVAFLFVASAIFFVGYGVALYRKLRDYRPIEAQIRQEKMTEIVYLTIVCAGALLVRSIYEIVAATALPILNKVGIVVGVYFCLVEIVPSALVLFILRKLPSKPRYDEVADADLKSILAEQ